MFSATYTGFVNNEPPSVVSGSPFFSTAANSTSPAGTYPIIIQAGTLNAANYSFGFVNGTLTITNAPVVQINISLTGNKIRLEWADPTLQLQSATSANGPWQLVSPTPTSPLTTGLTGASRYFRLTR